uniref:Uncharacterized protein n=1 Tax=Moniliophthora roreri TaxID=221103 RepID=A0A0W0EVR7_MONRR
MANFVVFIGVATEAIESEKNTAAQGFTSENDNEGVEREQLQPYRILSRWGDVDERSADAVGRDVISYGFRDLGERGLGSPLRWRTYLRRAGDTADCDFRAILNRHQHRYEDRAEVEPTSIPARRYSSASSILPTPAEMTILLQGDHDHQEHPSTLSYEPYCSVTITCACEGYIGYRDTTCHDKFLMSSGGIGSLGSLYLRPEHERHLGDGDSLESGYRKENEIW